MPATTSPAEADDGVILCHWGPSPCSPSISSFVLKLETYLKMAEIPYKNEFTSKTSSKGKMPYIKLEGKEIPDSNFIISYLNKKFEKNLDASLSDCDQAVSLAFKRLLEENLYWTLIHYRYMENFQTFSKNIPVTGLRKRLFPIMSAVVYKPSMKSSLHAHGIGRHSKEEIHEIMEKDLRALSTFLAEKEYFFGSEPTEIDASLFGFLVQCIHVSSGSPHEKLIKESLQNLVDYTKRMQERFWPDWEECCLQEKKKEEPPAKETPKEDEEPKEKEGEEKGEEKENGGGDAPAEESAKADDKVAEVKEENGEADKPKEEADPEK